MESVPSLSVAADPEERRARCTFVVVGAGYTGTEVAAQGQLLTTRLARTLPGLAATVFQKAGGDSVKTYWYAPGVGKIKEAGSQTEELVSFEVAE